MPTVELAVSFHHGAHCNLAYNRRHVHMRFLLHLKPQPTLRHRPKLQRNPKRECSSLQTNANTNSKTDAYGSLLENCANIKAVRQVHAQMLINGLEQNVYLCTKLINMYVRCGSLQNARLVFDKMNRRDVFLWNVMIKGYSIHGPWDETFALYYQMQRAGIQPNNFTFPVVLMACAALSALKEGKDIHDHVVRSGLETDLFVGAALVHMYAKCGTIEDARQVFDKMSNRDVVSWNTMIAGYSQNRCANEALTLFNQMQLADVKANSVTLVSLLPAFARAEDLQHGYVQNKEDNEALTFFYEMQLADVIPDSVTFVSVLPACAHSGHLQQGKRIHGYIIRNGFESDAFVGTALIDMYSKCGSVDIARHLFDKISSRDVVFWSAMISGYAQNGYANEALTLFHQMQLTNLKPDLISVVSVLQACAHLGALKQGRWIHDYILRSGFESNVTVGNSLVDMYAKCGRISVARQLFDKMPERNVVSWSAMIAGYGMHGYGEDALALFSGMQQTGTKPDHITFICVLSACSHAGLVDDGWQYFERMTQDFCITPRVEHYACMVDLLGRAGRLDEAQDFIEKMPLQPDAGVWGALLGACRIHRNIELGKCVAEKLFALEPKNAGYYVLLSNIYAATGMWDDVAKVRAMMKDRRLKKTPGCSVIEVDNRVHTFFMGDRSHPQAEKIYSVLETLTEQMEKAGYVPNMNFVLHDVEEEVKENLLSSHSEKLAIAFGLINTSHGTPIQIMKNLRVCGDCHTAIKFISKIVQREIIVRDANRFHHFQDGLCSCRDYW